MAQQQGGRRPSDAYNQNYGTPYRRVANTAPQQPRQAGPKRSRRQKELRERRRQELLRRRRRYRRAIFGVILLLAVAISFVVIKQLNGSWGAATDDGLDQLDLGELDEEAEEQLYDGPPIANIAFVGDISTSADQIKAVTKADGTYDFSTVFSEVTDYFSQDNVAYAVGDFETNMVDGLGYGTAPYYNSPIELAGSLRTLGLRLVSTANTYAINNGIEGLISTKNYLTEARIKSVGTYLSQEDRDTDGGAYIRNIHKIKFAFLSYTKGTDSVTLPDGTEYALNTLYNDYADYWSDLKSGQIVRDIQAAKDAGAEVIIALVHWGSENSRTVSEPQKEVAELMLESGVDVIIGTHSHLVSQMGFQEVEDADGSKRKCFVAYGLGDFYTDPTDEKSQQSMILNLEFSRGDNGKVTITNAAYVPIYMYITNNNGVKTFRLLDVYKNLATLKRKDMTADESELFNVLLDTVDTMHNYGGEELDAGPADADKRIVEKALEEGTVSDEEIREKRTAEAEAAQNADEEEPEEPITEPVILTPTPTEEPVPEEKPDETGDWEETDEE